MSEAEKAVVAEVPRLSALWRLGAALRKGLRRAGPLAEVEPLLIRILLSCVGLPSSDVFVRLPGGYRMSVPAGLPSGWTYAHGLYEPEVTRTFLGTLREGMTVVDAGANIGYYTILAAAVVGEAGRVYSFEPDPRNYRVLGSNVRRNGFRNVRVVRKAIADRSGSLGFHPDPWRTEGWVAFDDDHHAMEVQATSLDAFFAGLSWPPVDLVKMDIEGSEQRALEGMTELAARNPAMQMILEVNPHALRRNGSSVAGLSERLLSLGFRWGRVLERGARRFSLARGIPIRWGVWNILFTR